MKLFYDNQVDIATVSSDDENINYPASNVQDTRLSRIFRGDESITFDITGAGAPKNISQAYTNLVQDPTDLRAAGANWSAVNSTDEISTLSINGNLFTKIINSAATAGYNKQQFTTSFTNLILTGSVTLKKGSSAGNSTLFRVRNNTIASFIFELTIDFDNFGSSPGTPGTGTLLDYDWIDSETLKIYFQCIALANLTDNIEIRCFGSNNATSAEYTYWTEVQLIDKAEITMSPFVESVHAKDEIDETFTMADRLIVDCIIDPRLAFDNAVSNKQTIEWRIDATHYLLLRYNVATDSYSVEYRDGGTLRGMDSQQFDDGSSFTNINQRLRFTLLLNLTSGGTNDSMFIITPLESGSQFIDNSWSGTPDVKSSTFSTLSIGHSAGASQADSVFEYLRVYGWSGTKPTITSSQDMTDYLVDKKILLDKTYMKRLTATDLLIAGSTINDGDIIKLRGNDWDSFNSGTPVDETVTWSKDIITHTFTKASYQYWRLIVNSSNVIDMARIFLGLSYSTPYLGVDISHSYQSGTEKTRTPVGVTYGDIRIKYNMISVKWPKIITLTDKQELIAAFDVIDISNPFFVTFDETITDLGTLYVTMDGNGLHFVYYRNAVYSKAAISFIEEKG